MSNVVNIAKSYEGKVKYVFGAQDPDGGKSDCSGFTMVVFQKAGYSIPRTTGGVWTDSKLKKVEKTDLKAGDLILFKNTYNSGYTDGVSHIGIYIGNGDFIHCCSRGVVINNLSESYWSSHYLGAKRVDGASYGESESLEHSGSGGSFGGSDIGLKWWGDAVTVLLAGLLIICGVVMLVLGVKGTVLKE